MSNSESRRPNILFFFPDQFRADMSSVYDDRFLKTPHLERFAQQGTVFDNSVATCPVCTPWRGMLMTGRYPTHSGVLLNFTEAHPGQNPNCIANVFKRAGYATGYIGKWHLSAGQLKGNDLCEPDVHAMERYVAESNGAAEFSPPGPGRLGFDHWQSYNFHCEFNDYYWFEDEPVQQHAEGFETDIQVDQAIAYMQGKSEKDEPFMLMVSPHPPHPRFEKKYCPDGYFERVGETTDWGPNVPEDNPRDPVEMQCYKAMALQADDAFGRLMAFLDESGLSDNTIVIFTSDHGEMHGSHGRLNKMVPYREAVQVPLIVRWPGHVAAGVRKNTVFGPMDFMPTLCGMAGIEPPEECEGADLGETLLDGNAEVPRELLTMNYSSHWDFFQSQTQWPEWRGVHSGRYTYARWIDGHEELYDNDRDRYQMTNLVDDPEAEEVLAAHRARLAELLEEADDSFPPGTAYAEWFNSDRVLLRTSLGPVPE